MANSNLGNGFLRLETFDTRAPMSCGDGRNDPADRLPPPQAAGMSCYSVAEEISSICADFLVERRGFEPMAIAVSRPRIAGFRQRVSKEMRGRPDPGRRRSLNATATVARRCVDDCHARRSNWRSPRRSPLLNRAEPRQGHRYFDCRRKCSLSFGPYPCRLHNSKPLSRRDWLTKRQGGGVQ